MDRMTGGQASESGDQPRLLPRREFLKGLSLLGALAFLSPFLPGCFGSDTTSKEVPMGKVSLIKTTDRAQGVKRAIAGLDANPVRGKAVVLKPNFNSADVTPGSTHIDTLRALVDNLKEMGATGITLAERSGPGDPTQTVMEKKGIPSLAEEQGFDILNLQEMDDDGWIEVRPEGSHWSNGFRFPRIYTEAESIVQTCCLKTHAYGGHFTMSLKLSVGMVPGGGQYMRELHTSAFQREMIAEINTAYTTDLIVLDGVEAFVDGGPARGTRAEPGVMLASSDRVAIDAVGVAILRDLGTTPEVSRGRVFEQAQIARAAELGIGVASADEIELVSDDAAGEAYAARIQEILVA
ncbi:MAG: DUF362 domain-containing protein [Dehalococcoidales bacterium]